MEAVGSTHRQSPAPARLRWSGAVLEPDHPYRPFPVHRNPCGCTTPPPRRSRRRAPGETATIYVCGITPYDATHLGHAATYLAFDLVQRVWLDNGHRVHFVQNITDIDDPLLERAHRDCDRLARSGRQGDPALPGGHDRVAGAAAAGLHRRGRGDGRGVGRVRRLLDSGAAYRVDDPQYPGRLLRHRGRRRSSATNPGTTWPPCWRCPPSAAATRTAPGKRNPLDPLLWRTPTGGRAVMGVTDGSGTAGLAHRMRGDRRQPAGPDHRRTGRWQRSDLPAPRMFGGAQRGTDRRRAVRPALQRMPG